MPNKPLPGAVVFAKDVDRVAQFYQQLLSMAMLQAAPDKIVLQSDQMLLVIHGIPQTVAETIPIAEPPEPRVSTPIKLLLPVSSLAEARAKAPALGGRVDPPSAEWAAGNFRACDGFDPEGNVVQFRESAASPAA